MDKMRFLTAKVLFVSVALLLGACSNPITVGDEPVIFGFSADYQPTNSERHPSPPRQQRSADAPDGLQEIHVESVTVAVEAGFPTSVSVIISGTWQEPCSQLAEIKQTTNGKAFDIHLFVTSDGSACPSSQPGVPFGIDIPLNMAEKPAGTYTVSVNGKATNFEWNN